MRVVPPTEVDLRSLPLVHAHADQLFLAFSAVQVDVVVGGRKRPEAIAAVGIRDGPVPYPFAVALQSQLQPRGRSSRGVRYETFDRTARREENLDAAYPGVVGHPRMEVLLSESVLAHAQHVVGRSETSDAEGAIIPREHAPGLRERRAGGQPVASQHSDGHTGNGSAFLADQENPPTDLPSGPRLPVRLRRHALQRSRRLGSTWRRASLFRLVGRFRRALSTCALEYGGPGPGGPCDLLRTIIPRPLGGSLRVSC